jgi:trimeric autotransporter adhesin
VKLQLTNKFLHRVRIHGGEFDSSARAMNRAGEKGTLITYERALEAQADLRKFRGSTIERKHMSTKTTFKRVALVAVAALGLGVLASVPSQATVQAHSLTLSSATSTQLTNETSTASAAVATVSFLASDLADTVTITAFLMSAPAGNTVSPVMQVSETTSAVVRDDATGGSALAVGAQETDQTLSINSSANSATAVTAKLKVYMNSATVAGTYVVRLVPSVAGGGGVIDTTGVNLTITVSTNPATDTVASSATSILTTAADTTTTTDATVTWPMAASTANEAAVIKVGLLNAAGVATTGESYTATIAGPGLLASQPLDNDLSAAAVGRAITVKAGDVVTVYPDGSSGVATITITSAAGKILATETVTFYGAATVATATVVKPIINATSAQNAILVNMKDAAGTAVTAPTVFYVSSSDTTKISGAYTATSSITYSATNGTLGAGYLIPLTGVAAGSANITVGTKSSATATTGVDAAAVAVRVGSETPASVSVTLDKASYIPGEKATITVVLNDATGLPLADKTPYTNIFATGGIVADYTLGSGSDTTTATSVDGHASGKKTFTVYMPITESDVKFSWTTGTGLATANQAVAGSVTVTVSSSTGAAAIDAANEATDAANAATDAALAAADAADAATAAAEDASEAVAKLAKSVNTALNNLKKQITALTKLVNKLLK